MSYTENTVTDIVFYYKLHIFILRKLKKRTLEFNLASDTKDSNKKLAVLLSVCLAATIHIAQVLLALAQLANTLYGIS